eukprot:g4242.t1
MAEGDTRSLDRIKLLMASYYGTSSVDAQAEAEANAKDIDSSAFDADRYVESTLKESSVSSLLETNSKLQSETQVLDNDMQNLVYENYNKFINATDTLSQMKTKFREMETEMQTLTENVDRVDTLSAGIAQNLSGNREKIESLLSLQRLIKKLEFLFELPLRLTRSIELEAYGQAVRYYNTASSILNKYDNVPSFANIQKESNLIIAKLKRSLRERKQNPDSIKTSPKLIELTRLLVNLGDDKKALCDFFIKWHEKMFARLLTQIIQLQSPPEETLPLSPMDRVDQLNEDVISEVVHFTTTFADIFDEPELSIKNRPLLKQVFSEIMRYLKSSIFQKEAPQLASEFQTQETDLLVERLKVDSSGDQGRLGKKKKKKHGTARDILELEGNKGHLFFDFCAALKRVVSDIGDADISLVAAQHKLRLKDRVDEVVQHAFRCQIDTTFTYLHSRVTHEVRQCNKVFQLSSESNRDERVPGSSSSFSSSSSSSSSARQQSSLVLLAKSLWNDDQDLRRKAERTKLNSTQDGTAKDNNNPNLILFDYNSPHLIQSLTLSIFTSLRVCLVLLSPLVRTAKKMLPEMGDIFHHMIDGHITNFFEWFFQGLVLQYASAHKPQEEMKDDHHHDTREDREESSSPDEKPDVLDQDERRDHKNDHNKESNDARGRVLRALSSLSLEHAGQPSSRRPRRRSVEFFNDLTLNNPSFILLLCNLCLGISENISKWAPRLDQDCNVTGDSFFDVFMSSSSNSRVHEGRSLGDDSDDDDDNDRIRGAGHHSQNGEELMGGIAFEFVQGEAMIASQ